MSFEPTCHVTGSRAGMPNQNQEHLNHHSIGDDLDSESTFFVHLVSLRQLCLTDLQVWMKVDEAGDE